MKIKIFKDEIEIKIERPFSKLRDKLSEQKIDFSSISSLKGDKKLLTNAFREEFFDNIK